MFNKNEPKLTLRGLRAFVVVEETGSVSDGAKRIGGSSSGVSQQITALEEAVGVKLFDRQSRPLKLTPAGQMLRAHAHKILATVAHAQSQLSELHLAGLPKLTLAIIDDLDASVTPVLVSNLRQKFRGCFVSAYSGHSDYVTEMLEKRSADISISALVPEDATAFHSIPILSEPFILVTAKGLLDDQKDIVEQLSNAPFIPYSEATRIGRQITQHLKRVQFDTQFEFALEASRSVITMVVQENGWAITTPLNLLDGERFFPKITVSDLPFPAFSRQVFLISRTTELGELPDQLAADCRRLIDQQVIPHFASFVPHMAGAIKTTSF